MNPSWFKPGHKTNVGRKCTEETKKKMRENALVRINKGTFKSLFKIGHKTNLGRVQSQEQREKHRRFMSGESNPAKRLDVRVKLSIQKIGDSNPAKRPEIRLINSQKHRGKLFSYNLRVKHSAALQGIPITEWNGFKTSIRGQIYNSPKFKVWRKDIFKRDRYTCQDCYKVGNYLQAHHIKKFSKYPELRFNLNNGITLCKPCHDKT